MRNLLTTWRGEVREKPVSTRNLERIRSRGQGYLLGLKRRRNEQVQRYIEQAQGPWEDCPAAARILDRRHGWRSKWSGCSW